MRKVGEELASSHRWEITLRAKATVSPKRSGAFTLRPDLSVEGWLRLPIGQKHKASATLLLKKIFIKSDK